MLQCLFWRNSIFHRICCFSGGVSFPRISIGCLSMQRERMMNTDCEQEVEQDKREKSWTNTGRFKPADLSPLLKGEIKCYCGVFAAVVECAWVCMPLRHSSCSVYQKLPGWDPGFPLRLFNKLFTSMWSEWRIYRNHSQIYFKFISNQIQQRVLSSGSRLCRFISQRLALCWRDRHSHF